MPSREDPNPPEPVGIKEPTPIEAEIALQNDSNEKTDPNEQNSPDSAPVPANQDRPNSPNEVPAAKEYGGPAGLEPTRYGDWEKNGRCSDF